MSKQAHKSRANQPAGGFLALGREGSSTSDTSKTKSQTAKRELPQPQPSGVQLKKPRLAFASKAYIPPVVTSGSSKRVSVDDSKWRNFCAELSPEPKYLLSMLESAQEKQKPQKVCRIICAALRELIDHRDDKGLWGYEPLVCTALLTFVRGDREFFPREEVIEALCSMLSINLPSKSPDTSLAAILLFNILKNVRDWNWLLVDLFIDDSLHERLWVDRPSSRLLVENILTAFHTRIPSEAVYSGSELVYPEIYRHKLAADVSARFSNQDDISDKVLALIMQIKDICDRKGESVPRNLLKTMNFCSGNSSIRLLAARKMDTWLLNGKLQRYAMELLLWIASNMGSEYTEEDSETLSILLKLRALKSKQINIIFNNALREILNSDREMMCAVVKLLLSNEFSNNRFPYNMTMIQSLFLFDSNDASKVLARELVQMLSAKEEYLCVSRAFLREFMKSLSRINFDFASFTSYLFIAAVEEFSSNNAPSFLFKSLVDLCTVLPFFAITPTIRDGAQQRRSAMGSVNNLQSDALKKFFSELNSFFEVCINFLSAQFEHCDDRRSFVHSYYRILYFAPIDNYVKTTEQGLIESDVAQYIRVIADAPINSNLLVLILQAGCNASVPIDGADCIDLVDCLTKRAALSTSVTGDISAISIANVEIVDLLFQTTAYKLPPNFDLLSCEISPLAMRTLYWRAWLIAVIWSSLNISTLVKEAYNKYPTLKIIIQIILTWDYSFPPAASYGDQSVIKDIVESDTNALAEEQAVIRKLESCLASCGVSELEPKLSNKLCALNPTGVCRRPPDSFMHDLNKLNEELELSRSFSECRDPDLLADIVKSQGSARALPSIMNLVEANSSAITYLPIECICELFFHSLVSVHFNVGNYMLRIEKLNSMRNRLKNAISSKSTTKEMVNTILTFLTKKLSAHSSSERCVAGYCLSLLVEHEINHPILPIHSDILPARHFDSIPQFANLKHEICISLSQACSVENDVSRLLDYLKFLSQYSGSSNIHLVAHHISYMVERLKDGSGANELRTNAVSFFETYVSYVMKNNAHWTEELINLLPMSVTLVTVRIEQERKESLTVMMISTAVSGMLQLLCSCWKKEDELIIRVLMDLWFPTSSKRPVVINESGVELLPMWLKQKMLCTEDDRIVRVALDDMNPKDALKFVQCFALTAYSCSKLLSILDSDDTPLAGDYLAEARKAVIYIRAYQLKGAKGGDMFLTRLSEAEDHQKNIKIEVDESFAVVKLDPYPSMFTTDMYSQNRPSFRTLSKSEVSNCLEKMLLSSVEMSDWSSIIFYLSNDVHCARALITILKSKLSVLENTTVASSIFISLINSAEKDEFQLHLVEKFLEISPEILPVQEEKMSTILKLLFSSSAPALTHIISLLPTRCSQKILEKVVDYLLNSYRTEFHGFLVVRTIYDFISSFNNISLSEEHVHVLFKYVISGMENEPNNIINSTINFLAFISKKQAFAIRVFAKEIFVILSTGNHRSKRMAEKIAKAFTARFPDVRFGENLLTINSLRTVFTQDRTVHNVILNLFSAVDFSITALNEQISALSYLTIHQPKVVLRHLHLVSAGLSTIAQYQSRLLRSNNYQALLLCILRLVISLAPESFEQADKIEPIFVAFFTFLKDISSRGRAWFPVIQTLQKLCVTYLELNSGAAKPFFTMKSDYIKHICMCFDTPNSKILLENHLISNWND